MPHVSRRSLVKAGVAGALGSLASRTLPAEAVELTAAMLPPPMGGQGTVADESLRERLLMDFGWKFHLGDACDPAKDLNFGIDTPFHTYGKTGNAGAVTTLTYDDSAWRTLDLPHDWSVELPFIDDKELVSTGSKPLSRQYPATSIGWYRRTFTLPAQDDGKRLTLTFDGIFRAAQIFVNGQRLGENFSGYAPASYDITDLVNYGDRNVVVVRVDATLHEGWFFEGAGIYRHVWLTKTNPVSFVEHGIFVQATDIAADACTLIVSAEVCSRRDPCSASVSAVVLDDGGRVLAQMQSAPAVLSPGETATVSMTGKLRQPHLWSLEDPYMHKLVATVHVNGTAVDSHTVAFGVRSIRFDADQGFLLNGQRVEIRGTCNHQDHAGVGVALPDRLNEYRVELLHAMGSNACRTSHNPPTPEFLDACDRLGMLVMDETRLFSSNAEGLSQLERLVRRDRNHPSVIIWSVGNEEPLQSTPIGARMGTTMKQLIHRLDPSRPVTEAQNKPESWGQGISQVVDVQGFNYGTEFIDKYRRDHPKQPLIGTETASTVSTRGIYENDPQRGYVSAYDANHPKWAALAEEWWPFYAERPWLSGGFVWTGFDYRGEPTPYGLPCISSHFGVMDTCGFPKDLYHYYRAWWGAEPHLHLFPHWNWSGKEGQEIDVWCFSNQDAVELFLNGTSLGRKDMTRYQHVAWKVTYSPGVIEARAYKDGHKTLVQKRETTGAPAKLAFAADRTSLRADGQDVAMLTARVLDAQGRDVPTAGNKLLFEVSGPGALIGVGNGDPSCHESDKGPERSAFNGLAAAIVQTQRGASGSVVVKVSSSGLQAASVTLATALPGKLPAVVA